mmetsp:Transcript_1838/g.7626  ORF Transcript_1838/g.7626 Transcript_1838/m.7626 type:complete len:346 (+) Transcript_1838:417-1454(+)
MPDPTEAPSSNAACAKPSSGKSVRPSAMPFGNIPAAPHPTHSVTTHNKTREAGDAASRSAPREPSHSTIPPHCSAKKEEARNATACENATARSGPALTNERKKRVAVNAAQKALVRDAADLSENPARSVASVYIHEPYVTSDATERHMYKVMGTKTSIGGRRLAAPFALVVVPGAFRGIRGPSRSDPSSSSPPSPRRGATPRDSSSVVAGTYTSTSRKALDSKRAPRSESRPDAQTLAGSSRAVSPRGGCDRDTSSSSSSSCSSTINASSSSSTSSSLSSTGGVSNPARVANASAAYATATTTKTLSNPRSGPNALWSPAYARGVTMLASPNAPMVKLSACAHFS